MAQRKIVLAFSGGLDTSYALVAHREAGDEVLTVTVNTGGLTGEEETAIRLRAEELGSAKHIVVDARKDLYNRFITYIIKSNYLRNGVYPSCVGVERMIQAEEVTRVALAEGAEAIVHGSTGAGNDHIRFDAVISTLAPKMQIITPVRDDGLKREEEQEFLRSRGFEAPEKTARYSFNVGLVGISIGGEETYGTWDYLPEEAWPTTRSIDDAPVDGIELVITFEKGLPVEVKTADGKSLAKSTEDAPYAVLQALNELGAEHGVGRGIHSGQTIMGNPARLGFEAPGMLTIIAAHRELERNVLTNRQQLVKANLANTYGDALHEAIYYDPVMADLEALFDKSQRRVTGEVRVRLQKGNITPLGTKSPFSMLDAAAKRGTKYGYGSSIWTGDEARGYAHIYGVSGSLSHSITELEEQ